MGWANAGAHPQVELGLFHAISALNHSVTEAIVTVPYFIYVHYKFDEIQITFHVVNVQYMYIRIKPQNLK